MAALILLVLAFKFMPFGTPADMESAGSPSVVLVVEASGGLDYLEWRGDSLVSVGRRDDTPASGRESENGGRFAVSVQAADGENLAIVDWETCDTTVVTSAPSDEYPLEWSPDGRRIMFSQGILAPGSEHEYRRVPRVLDLSEGTIADLGAFDLSSSGGASWSPTGTRIAFVAVSDAGSIIVVSDADGGDPSILTSAEGGLRDPDWSPDGSLLAYVVRSEQGGSIVVDRLDGSTPSAVVGQAGGAPRSPVWLTEVLLAYALGFADEAAIKVVNVFSGEPVATFKHPQLGSLLGIRRPWEDGAWIDSIRVSLPMHVVSPGQFLHLAPTLIDARGRSVPTGARAVRWTVSNDSVMVHEGNGRFRVVGEGESSIIAGLAGWRSTSVHVASVPVRTVQRPELLTESWSSGLRDHVWMAYGVPLPFVRSGGSPAGGYLVNNGDDHYTSGVVSVERFPLADGLTVEYWGSAPFRRVHYEGLAVALTVDVPAPDEGPTWQLDPAVRVQLHGESWMVSPAGVGVVVGYPIDFDPAEWHLYALQYNRDHTVSFVVDGRVVFRRAADWRETPPDSVYVALFGASLGNEIKHGPVTVYEGERYVLDMRDPRGQGPGG